MEEPRVKPIPSIALAEWWPRILPWAEEFCEHSQGSFDSDYIRSNLEEGTMQLWAVTKEGEIVAVCVTEIRRTLLKECVIVVMTGEDMPTWLHLIEVLEQYAVMMGCQKIIGVARLGWAKILKPYGYVPTHIQVEKML